MSFIDLIKDRNKEEIKKTKITAEDIRELANYYEKIENLEKLYASSSVRRMHIANEIRKELFTIKAFANFLENNMRIMAIEYEYAPIYISDFLMAIRLLTRLANQNNEKYILKTFKASEYRNMEEYREIWVIGDKNIIEELDAEKIYYRDEFSKIARNILETKYSLIMATNYYDKYEVRPRGVGDFLRFKEVEIKEADLTNGGISCYLYDDELRSAVDKFMAFINQNGADIKGIDEDELFNLIAYPENIKEDEPQARALKP